MDKIYDVIILGGGVGGMSAAIYAKRSGKSVLIVERMALGGQVASLQKIENFPSQTEIDGFSLSQKFADQVKALNVEIVYDEIISVDLLKEIKSAVGKRVQNGENTKYLAKNIIIATGMTSVGLGINEDEFFGKGVSYCAVCDANFFKNRSVCVASKKGSGMAEAIVLSKVCSSVTVLDSEDMSIFAKANRNEKIKVVSNAKILKICGQNQVEFLEVEIDGRVSKIDSDAVFVALGKIPSTKLFKGQVELDEKGFVKTNEQMQTSESGVFAVGDVRAGVLKQIVTACSDGAIAGTQI